MAKQLLVLGFDVDVDLASTWALTTLSIPSCCNIGIWHHAIRSLCVQVQVQVEVSGPENDESLDMNHVRAGRAPKYQAL